MRDIGSDVEPSVRARVQGVFSYIDRGIAHHNVEQRMAWCGMFGKGCTLRYDKQKGLFALVSRVKYDILNSFVLIGKYMLGLSNKVGGAGILDRIHR